MNSKEYRSIAWNALRGNWTTAVLAAVIVGLITAALANIPFATIITFGWISIGMNSILLSIIRGESSNLKQLGDGLTKGALNNFAAGVLQTLYVFLWSLLFIIPGLIKSYAYSMTFFILKDNPEMSANDAISKSQQMMQGHKMELFMLDVSFIGWYLLSILTLGVLMLWVEPYHLTARAAFYENLKNHVTYENRDRSYYQSTII